MYQHYDVVIVGGGLVGASFALALKHLPLKVALIEPTPPTEAWQFPPEQVGDVDHRVSALSLTSQEFLRRLGVWDALPQCRLCHYQGMEVWDAATEGKVTFDASEVHQTQLGCIVENRLLLSQMWQLLTDNEAPIQEPPTNALKSKTAHSYTSDYPGLSRIQCIKQPLVSLLQTASGVQLTLASGEALHARLLVGADGVHSKVRSLAQIPKRQWSYRQRAMVATIATEKPHQNQAYQCFGRYGPMAYLPLAHQHLCSIVWSLDEQKMQAIERLEFPILRERIAQALDHRLGSINSIGDIAVYPLNQCHAKTYYRGNLILMGDAAHCIHPLAGQGVNLGFLDAAVLAEEITRNLERAVPIEDAGLCMAYERRRMPENLAAMAAMEGFKRLFSLKHWSPLVLRSLGMKLFQKAPWLKKGSIRTALGLYGDLPKGDAYKQ